ncbi:MAG: DegT/DnrJ/EryC1/StrS family aminotransferase [Spiribacter sp.]|jgi:dTDP-4-amino-4,6-dideoxygalactose transaminase|nr:DegT/DnrJ/EryC1/StrS family aminotransferase [Spiribacter sp.]MDR9489297.1 DegT/DnrJ/EryC1/StrS family aminotransferase [Spiribacter sp.]
MSEAAQKPIPMVDLTAQYPMLRTAIESGLHTALDEAKFILGPNVQAFEKQVSEYLGVEHAIGVASGTDALHLALLAAGVRAGDEVITTPFSFISTAEAICYIGAIPVFADIDPKTFNIDPQSVAEKITPKTRAILPVHLFGQPANMPALETLATRHKLVLVEDCAQSFGARIDKKMTGSMGVTGAFSFFPSKNLGGYGDGGMVTTQDKAMAEEIIALRNHGSRERYYHYRIGFNSRLDELQAVILQAKLAHIDAFNAGRQRVARLYSEGLADVSTLSTPYADGLGVHVYHQYTLLCENEAHRSALMSHLAEHNIASAVYYPVPLHQQEAFSSSARPSDQAITSTKLPVAESIAKRCMSLPMYPELTPQAVNRVITAIKDHA